MLCLLCDIPLASLAVFNRSVLSDVTLNSEAEAEGEESDDEDYEDGTYNLPIVRDEPARPAKTPARRSRQSKRDRDERTMAEILCEQHR